MTLVAAVPTRTVDEVPSSSADAAAWVPESCTLPTVQRPLRIAEFDDLFTSLTAVDRDGGILTMQLAGGADVLERARDLAAREAQCCSFFEFIVERGEAGSVMMTVGVGPAHLSVLDSVERQARSRLG